MFKIDPKTGRLTSSQPKIHSPPMLPNRAAMHQLTKGDPEQRSVLNYAKLTPVGQPPNSYQDIIDMATNSGASVLPK